MPLTDIGSGGINGLMDLDEPPVRIGIVIACGLPDHAQAIRETDQPDDRRFIGCTVATSNELLGLARLDRQPDLATECTGCIRQR